MATEEGLSTGKTILIGAIVLGCFAVLWPKIFAPMLFEEPAISRKAEHPMSGSSDRQGFVHPALRGEHIASGRGRPGPGGLMGGEGDGKLFYGEEGKQMRRPMEFRPGPVPGMRPSMGGPGMQPPAQQRGQGTMGILMPIYTIGIVIFFLYTVMKVMFKRENEQEEKYTQQQQQQKMRATPHQYGQQQYHQYRNDATPQATSENFDPANLRMRQFQQQQQRMHHMQNVNSHKQYQKPISPLSSIPEIHQKGPSVASNLQNNATDNGFNSTMDKRSPSLPKSSDPSATNNDTQNKNNLEEVNNADSTSISNVMEDLINVAESVVASRQSTNAPFGNPENVIRKEELKKDAREDELASLRKKLEETQRTMEQIMAEVNKVSGEIKEPVDKPLLGNSVTDNHANDYETTGSTNNIKLEHESADIRQQVSDNSSSRTCNLENNEMTLSSSIFQEELVAEKYSIENIEGRQLFRNTSDHEYQDDSSSNSTRSSNEEGMENAHHYVRDVPLNEPHHEQGIERDCEEASTDSDECSESYDGDIQQYDVTDFDRENIYQDESEYYYYHDEKFEYYEENNSESDEDLDEYNHPVQVETNKNVDDDGENEDTNDPIENDDQGAVGSEENTTSYNHDPSMEKGDSNVSENHHCKDEETNILQARLRPESQERVIDSFDRKSDSEVTSNSLNVISSLEPDNEADANPEYEHQLNNDDGPLINDYSNNEVEESSMSHQHRKAVELIESNEDDGNNAQRECKPAPSFLGAHNGKIRRRKRLRKT